MFSRPQNRLLNLVGAYKARTVEDLRQATDNYRPFDAHLEAAFGLCMEVMDISFPAPTRTLVFQELYGRAVDKLAGNLAGALNVLINAGVPTMTAGDLSKLHELRSQVFRNRNDLLFAAGLRSGPSVNPRPLQRLPRKPLL